MKRVILVALATLLSVVGVASAQPPASPAPGPGSFTVSAEALLWWFKGNATPPLISDGLIGGPGTRVLLGGRDENTNPNPGLRLNIGYGLSDRWGLDSSVFYIPTRTTSRSVSSSGKADSKDLFVPVIDPFTGESVQNISSAGLYSGQAREQLSNSLLGADLNVSMRLASGATWRVDALGGFRYLRLRESFVFTTSSPNIPPFPADVYQTSDNFDATNNFFGGQLGARARADWGSIFASALVKVGLGVMRQTVDIEGTLRTNDFIGIGAPPIAYPGGGYFATPTNIGQRSRSVFAVVPEAGIGLGYRLTPWMSIVSGYTFLCASDVVRAPQQIVRTVNYSSFALPPGPPTGPQVPVFRFKSSDFWAQGLSVGLEFRF